MAVSEWQGAGMGVGKLQHTASHHAKCGILYFALQAWDPKSPIPFEISFAIYLLATHSQS